jgi:hypothetical protein
MMMMMMIIIWIAQYVFGYAGGHRFESSKHQIPFSSIQRLNCLGGPEILLKHDNRSVKLIQFREP